MSHTTQITRTWGLFLPFALMLVLAVPAGAKGPVVAQPQCPPSTGTAQPPRVAPDSREACTRQGLDGSHPGILAGGTAALVLALASGKLVRSSPRQRSRRARAWATYVELEALWLLPAREVEHDA